MVAAIVALITTLISFFASKKSGASDGEAALIAAGAGAGTYYVGTQTEWGKGIIDNIENWVGIKDKAGQPVLNDDGSEVRMPQGATVVTDGNGVPQKDPQGNVMWKLVDSTGKVLQSWGPTGTAAVVGTGALAASDDDLPSWLLPAGLGLAVYVLLK